MTGPPRTVSGPPHAATVIEAVLASMRTVAVVGCSTHPAKAAHAIPRQVQAAGYRIIPVHPSAEQVLGERAYRRLADIPEPIDVVDVFRPSAEAGELSRQAVAAGARAVWLQSGIRSPEARAIAEDAQLLYVEDACLAVELHRRLRSRRP